MNEEIKKDVARAKEIVHKIDELETELETELGELLGYGEEEEEEDSAPEPIPKPKQNKCSICGESGHSKKTCLKNKTSPIRPPVSVGQAAETRGSKKRISDDIILAMMSRVDAGESIPDLCKEYKISDYTYYTRRKKLSKPVSTENKPQPVPVEKERDETPTPETPPEETPIDLYPPLSREQFTKVKQNQEHDIPKSEIAGILDVNIREVIFAFASNIYETYIEKRESGKL